MTTPRLCRLDDNGFAAEAIRLRRRSAKVP